MLMCALWPLSSAGVAFHSFLRSYTPDWYVLPLSSSSSSSSSLQSSSCADSKTGKFIRQWGETGRPGSQATQLHFPAGLAVHKDHLWVADTNNHRVQVFHIESGALVRTLGTGQRGSPNEPGGRHLNTPRAVAIDALRDLVLICEGGNKRISVFRASTCEFIGTFGARGQFSNPVALTMDPGRGLVYVVDSETHRVLVFAMLLSE